MFCIFLQLLTTLFREILLRQYRQFALTWQLACFSMKHFITTKEQQQRNISFRQITRFRMKVTFIFLVQLSRRYRPFASVRLLHGLNKIFVSIVIYFVKSPWSPDEIHWANKIYSWFVSYIASIWLMEIRTQLHRMQKNFKTEIRSAIKIQCWKQHFYRSDYEIGICLFHINHPMAMYFLKNIRFINIRQQSK